MPRLALLAEYPTLSGGERSLLAVLPRVAEAGFDVAAIAPAEGALAERFSAMEIDVIDWSPIEPNGRRASQAERRRRLGELLDAVRPDLLHANSLAMGRLAGPVAQARGLPCVAHLRDVIGISRQAVADLNCNDRLLAVSNAVRRHYLALGVEANRIATLYNGVDLVRFSPRRCEGWLHEELNIPPNAPLAIAIGQFALRKGWDVLIETARRLADRCEDLHWIVVGERFSEKDESRRLEASLREAAETTLAGRMHLLGSRDDVERLLVEATVLVHCARQEPLGRVLLEAAASGLAVVASDVGGTGEIFLPEENSAWLVSPNDPEAAASAVEAAISDANERSRRTEIARRRMEEFFSDQRSAEGLIEHYQWALERRNAS
jgi:glycosyltransferase involved in cell wall biosynthesis